MKLLKALFVVALVVAFAVPAYAETQNVKVSGSIDTYWFYRENYDLVKSNDHSIVLNNMSSAFGTNRTDAANFFRTNTQLEVAADLTDNVSTVVNVVNERDWNSNIQYPNSKMLLGTALLDSNEFDIMLDKAYVQMKEIFYSPLTLTFGRQNLWFGRGFIIGNNNRMWNPNSNLAAPEYSVQTAFDAVRATLDFSPWTIDAVYSKIQGGSQNANDDLDLYIANVNYKFAEYNAVAEAYYVGQFDRNTLVSFAGATKGQETNTVGGRVQFDPISQITLGGELAYQFGHYRADISDAARSVGAWATDVFGTYRWDYSWKPEVTIEYVLFSGESDLTSGSTADYGGWNGLYRGKFWTAYADFRSFVYGVGDVASEPATTNEQFIQAKGTIKPLEDLLLEGSFTYLWNVDAVHSDPDDLSSGTRSKQIGYEIDLQATYDYTEDVSFGLLVGWFVPGNFYKTDDQDSGSHRSQNTALDVVSSVKVTF